MVNQFSVRNRETKRPDVVLFVNSLPLVVGETKTPVLSAVSWLDSVVTDVRCSESLIEYCKIFIAK